MKKYVLLSFLLSPIITLIAPDASATPVLRSCISTIRLHAGTVSDSAAASAHIVIMETGNGTGSGECNYSGCTNNNFAYIDFVDKDLYAMALGAALKGTTSVSAPLFVQYKTEQPSSGVTGNVSLTSTCKIVSLGFRP